MTAPAITVNYSASVSGTTGTIAVGNMLVPVSGSFVVATTANRALGGRAQGIALSAWGSTLAGTVAMQTVGPVDATITGLGTGTASWVRVSALGVLERCTPSGSDDIVGYCWTDGTLMMVCGFLTAAIVNGGGSTPTGTGFSTVTGGVADAASLAYPLPVANGGTGVSSLTVPATGLLVGTTDAQTLTNKVINGANNNLTVRLTTTDVTGTLPVNKGGTNLTAPPGNASEVLINSATTGYGAATNVLAGSSFISIGATPATAGSLRLPSAGYIAIRNSGNSADVTIAEYSASDFLYLGTDSALTVAKTAGRIFMFATSGLVMGNNGSTMLSLASGQVLAAAPVVGDGTNGSSPWAGMNGMFVKSMAGSTYTLVAVEYGNSIIKVTGSGTNVIKLPAQTDSTAFMKFYWNAGSGTLAIQDTNSVAAAATLAAGTGAWFLHANAAVKQMSAAFTVA